MADILKPVRECVERHKRAAAQAYFAHRERCDTCTGEVHCDIGLDLAEALVDEPVGRAPEQLEHSR